MRKFVRKDGYVGGVCAGLGHYTGIAPILWRIGFLVTGWVLIYILLWAFTKQEY